MRGRERRGPGGSLRRGLRFRLRFGVRRGVSVGVRHGSGLRLAVGPRLLATRVLRTRDPGPGGHPDRDASPAPTRLTVAVDTRGGRLALVRGGAPQEFTVTLWNGNSAAYRHVLVAFQMEMLVGEPGAGAGGGSGFLLERFDPASGSWRPAADFRVANDVKPPSQFSGGGPLAREAVRTERYRLRATAGGPTGSSPLVVSFIDTDADGEVAAHVVLGHSTR